MHQGLSDAHDQIDVSAGRNVDLFNLTVPKNVFAHDDAQLQKVFPYVQFVDLPGDDSHVGFVTFGQHAHPFVVDIVVFALFIHDAQEREALCYVNAHTVAGCFHTKDLANIGIFFDLLF